MNEKANGADDNRAVLVRAPFLVGLPGSSALRLLAIMTPLNLSARETVFREGDRADAFYCVLSGYVRLYRLNRDGREADIRICGPGDTFAECLIGHGETYPYHARVAEKAMLARFDMEAMREIVAEDEHIAAAVILALSRNLIASMECISDDRLHTAPQRVAKYILSHCPPDSGSAAIRLPFQKSLLAGMLGLAPEALSRAFSHLRCKGVEVRGRVIRIADIEALRNL